MQIEVLGERYQLQEPIGRGGMATIYRGRDLRMDRVVAIKVLREVYSTDPKFVTRFQREAKAASALQHPNIVQVYDYGQTEGNYFIVMECIEGTDLRRYLRSRGLLDIDRAIIIAHDVALGLGAAHRRGIVHRDVKPQNILVGRDGSIKLTDFGIASVYKDINAERLTTTGMTLGTVQYYAPEQAQGEIVSPAADVYALGIVIYEMLTGRTPFDGDTPVAVAMQHIQDLPVPPSQLNPNIPPALEDIIMRCLEKIPEMRYRDGSALARALENLGEAELSGDGLPTGATPGTTSAPVPAYGQRVPGAAGAVSDPATVAWEQDGRRASTSSPQHGAPVAPFAGAMVEQHYPPQAMYGGAPLIDSGTTRPFQRGAMQDGGRDSRFASIMTALIFLATLLLLGFSVYLASVLGYVRLPFSSGPVVTSTPAPPGIPVPNLIGLSYQEAQTRATNAGFVLQVNNGLTAGYVQNQWPAPAGYAAKGSTILINLQPGPLKVIVPAGLVGNTLSGAEAILNSENMHFVIQPAGNDPTKPANYVSRVSPASGHELPKGQNVVLYVTNLTNGTPAVSPGASPTVSPGTLPTTAKPTPSPTTAKPTATPTTAPIPTVTPVTPGVTPSPKTP
ncbi:MAG: protein kinase [Ktedonobacteraceae bacterium]|nr:protein kinase [Ktedonobacteraceae bacterium]